eukprot:c26317_g1_i1.p1 GENE.c26317_g1_i1~~c26317_g1_i1.p1  ORF type:complete len:280 (-),score=55.10 c26317_g1_i1:64-798(-)
MKIQIESKEGLPPDIQRLIFGGRQLENNHTLTDCGIGDQATVHLVMRLGGPPRVIQLSELVAESLPRVPFEQDPVPTDDIFVRFNNTAVDPDWFAESNSHIDFFQNLWSEYFPRNDPHKNYQFTTHTPARRILLLELRADEFTPEMSGAAVLEALDTIRYSCFGFNRTYYGGDVTSWQRYTSSLPIAEGEQDESDSAVFKFPVQEPLDPSLWYAIAILHGNHQHKPTYSSKMLYDDYLIPFKPQ